MDIIPRQSQLLCQQHCILRYIRGMLEGKGILRIDGSHQCIHRRCHLFISGLFIPALRVNISFIYLDPVLAVLLCIKSCLLSLLKKIRCIRRQSRIPCHTDTEGNRLHDLWFVHAILLYCTGQHFRQCHQCLTASLRHRNQEFIGAYAEYFAVLRIFLQFLRTPF